MHRFEHMQTPVMALSQPAYERNVWVEQEIHKLIFISSSFRLQLKNIPFWLLRKRQSVFESLNWQFYYFPCFAFTLVTACCVRGFKELVCPIFYKVKFASVLTFGGDDRDKLTCDIIETMRVTKIQTMRFFCWPQKHGIKTTRKRDDMSCHVTDDMSSPPNGVCTIVRRPSSPPSSHRSGQTNALLAAHGLVANFLKGVYEATESWTKSIVLLPHYVRSVHMCVTSHAM